MTTLSEARHNHIAAGIETLRAAVAQLRLDGFEVLSAHAGMLSAPEIHVGEPQHLADSPAVYVAAHIAGSIHFAVPYMGCTVIWIDRPTLAGLPPAEFPPLERHHHG